MIRTALLATIILPVLMCAVAVVAQAPASGATPAMTAEAINLALIKSQAAATARNYPEAVKILEEVLAKEPNLPGAEYNLACYYALTGKTAVALIHLDKAVSLGFLMIEHMQQDQDLNSLRALPQYAEIMAKAGRLMVEHQQLIDSLPAPKSIFLRAKGMPSDRAVPLVVFLHDMGGSPADLEPVLAPLTDPDCGFSLLLPCGGIKLGLRPDGKPGYGWNGPPDLEAILGEVAGLSGICPDQVYLAGFSAGGTICHFAALTKADRLAGVLVFSGGFLDDFKSLPTLPPEIKKPPVLIVYGQATLLPEATVATNAGQYLREQGYRVELKAWAGGHALPPNVVAIVQQAIRGFASPPPVAQP